MTDHTPDPEAGLRAMVEKWKSDSLDIQANYDARHPKMGYAKGLDDCAKQVAAYLATRTDGRRQEQGCSFVTSGGVATCGIHAVPLEHTSKSWVCPVTQTAIPFGVPFGYEQPATPPEGGR